MSALDAPESSRAREEAAEQEPKSEPPQSKWLALVSVADLPANEDDERAQKIVDGTDVLLNRNDPPLPSRLVLHPRVAADPRRNNEPMSAYILAADRSGFILFQLMEGNIPDFFLCNTHTSTVTIIPPVSSYIQTSKALDIEPILSIGLIADPHHRCHFVVAQLHPTNSNDYLIGILYYSTAKGKWFSRDLAVQQGGMPNPFSETGVLAHDGRLWWIALASGVFYCDPFVTPQAPELRFLSLPPGCEMDGDVGFDPRIRTLLDQRRCVRLSEGKLRFVEIRGLSYDDERIKLPAADPTVWMWTLEDPEGETPWTLEYEVAFAEIRGLPSADEGLQQSEMPHVALVDPNDHYVVYFLQGSKLFAVDMRENVRKVVSCEQCRIDPAQLAFRSSRPIVDAWEVSPPPHKLPGNDDSSPDDNVWSTQSYVEKKKLEVTGSVDSWLNQARLGWARNTDASVENWRAWQMAPPPSDESSVNSGGRADDEPPPSDESSVNSGGQADDQPELQVSHFSVGDVQSPPPSVCYLCRRCCDKQICSRCIAKEKRNLLAISETDWRTGELLGYCLDCHQCISKKNNHVHEGNTIPLDWYDGKKAAWVKGGEKWASIFEEIQGEYYFNIHIGRPFIIHQPQGIRCRGCNDMLTTNLLYGSFTSFCDLHCWVKSGNRGEEAQIIADILLTAQFGDELDAICLTCHTVFSSNFEDNNQHMDHDWLPVRTDNAKQSWVQIPRHHHFSDVWSSIKGLEVSSWTGEILIKHATAERCQYWNCRMRLVDGGGKTCCLQCSKNCLLPRSLLCRAHDEPEIQLPPSP